MNTLLNDIRDVFSILHDGVIVDCEGDLNKLTLTIQCNYLAELINPNFKNFHIDLIAITKLNFVPWVNPIDLKAIQFKSHEEFLKVGLEIISAELKDGCVFVSCLQDNTDLDYSGGHLMISAKDFNLYDHDKNTLTTDKLDSACRFYWDLYRRGE